MLDMEGNEVDDPAKMVGRPTKYKIVKPEYLLFVDEAGCNTNQKDDGLLGGRLRVLPVYIPDCGTTGATTNINFTVMCFTSGIGVPVMLS
jgi:hypothetical protein